MAPQSDRIVSDPDTLGGQPRIQGRRISVLQIVDEVEGRGDQPHTVADRYDLSISDVYRALAYFHEHPEEMATAR
ncbi:MAG: DUF433 domain-containing protein [Natrialbaceae archaeon]|nr:DUF433 domain-containing protein [Natrialbaceae archaeon]